MICSFSRCCRSIPRSLAILLLLTTLIRGLALWAGGGGLHEDPDAYLRIAATLTATGTLGITSDAGEVVPTAFRPPLYPALIATARSAMITVGADFADPTNEKSERILRGVIASVHLLLGLATVAATFFVARRWSDLLSPSDASAPRETTIAWLAGLLVAIDPILIQSSCRVMTETLATALAAGILVAWMRLIDRTITPPGHPSPPLASGSVVPTAVGLGMLLGLAHLCRPTFFVWTALLIGYLAAWSILPQLWSRLPGSLGWLPTATRLPDPVSARIPLTSALIVAAAVSLWVGGWTLRNLRQFGEPIWATTHGGYTLLLGNNPPFYDYLKTGRLGVAWDPDEFFERWEMRDRADPREEVFWTQPICATENAEPWQTLRPEADDEVGQDRLAYETAKWSIRRDPASFFHACVWRLTRLLGPMPQRPPSTPADAGLFPGWGILAVTTFYTLVWLAILRGAVRLRGNLLHPHTIAALALVVSLVAVHAVYWSNLRMRAPAVPPLAILAAIGILPGRNFLVPNERPTDRAAS